MKNNVLWICCAAFALMFCSSIHAGDGDYWPRFRGPNGQGISSTTGLPVQWSKDENIVWKTAIPGQGWSSPIVWADRVFLTTTTEEGKNCHVIALDGATGEILWDKTVFTQETKFKHGKNSHATSTPVTDGKHVYAVFSSGAFVALDFDGNVVWTSRDLDFYSQHGLAASPILYKDLLLLAVGPSNREEPKGLGWREPWDRCYLLALDKKTGKERWRGQRGMARLGHATPCIVTVDGKDQILSPTGDVIQAFDPENGDLLWTVQSQGEPSVASPAVGDGLVFSSASASTPIHAVRPGGKGDCTATHLAWEQKRNSPMMSSFLYVKPCLYTATDNGSFSCYDAATGEVWWQKRLGAPLNPSPLFADGKFYLLDERGTTTVLQASPDPKEEPAVIATNELDEQTLASIAVLGKRLLIRTAHDLWCVGR